MNSLAFPRNGYRSKVLGIASMDLGSPRLTPQNSFESESFKAVSSQPIPWASSEIASLDQGCPRAFHGIPRKLQTCMAGSQMAPHLLKWNFQAEMFVGMRLFCVSSISELRLDFEQQ